MPGGTPVGTYTIQAVFSGTADFLGFTDKSHSLSVGTIVTATAAASASVTFGVGDQNVPLSASITSTGGIVNGGTETFTILSGTTVIGTPVTVSVSAGAAAAVYALPGGTPASKYTIEAVYNGTPEFVGSTDTSHFLTINAAASATAATNVSVPFDTGSQDISLSATVTSAAGVVSVGTETFTILSGTTVIGVPVTVNVSAGAAAAVYILPAATPAGSYTIEAAFTGAPDFTGSSDKKHSLTVSAAATATVAATASVPFSAGAQDIPLTATVTSVAGVVSAGTATFSILSGTTVIGLPVTVNVSAGAAAAVYILPAGTPAGTYTIEAAYNGTLDFSTSSDTTHKLTVAAASISVTGASVEWGSQIAALQTASDGLRLLPAGRTTDLPWFNINRIPITLSQAATLEPGRHQRRWSHGGQLRSCDRFRVRNQQYRHHARQADHRARPCDNHDRQQPDHHLYPAPRCLAGRRERRWRGQYDRWSLDPQELHVFATV